MSSLLGNLDKTKHGRVDKFIKIAENKYPVLKNKFKGKQPQEIADIAGKVNKNKTLPYHLLDRKKVRFSKEHLPSGPIYSQTNARKKLNSAIETGNQNKIKKAFSLYLSTLPKNVFKPVQITKEPTSQQQQQTSQQQQQTSRPTLRQRQPHLPQIGLVEIIGLFLLMIAVIIGPILLILFSSSNTSDTDDDNEEDFNNYYYNTDTTCQCDKCKNFNITNNIMPYNI